MLSEKMSIEKNERDIARDVLGERVRTKIWVRRKIGKG